MKCLKYIVLGILLTVFLPALKAQDIPTFDNLTTDNGLSEGFVYGVIVDKKGFLWLATRDGLNRYDGYSYTVFKNNTKDSTSISNNTIHTLYITRDGSLWIGTQGGLNTYDYNTGVFTSFKNDPNNNNSLSHNAVYALYEDSYGVLWVGTFGGGACAFDRKKKIFKRYMNNPNQPGSLSGNAIRALVEDNDRELWVGVDGGGLNKFNRSKQTFTRYMHNSNDDKSLGSDIVLCVTKDSKGYFWVGSWASGITRFDPREGKAVAYYRHDPGNKNSISSDENFAVVEASTGDFWIATRRGLDKMNPSTGIFSHYQHDPLVESSLVSDVVCNIYEDKNGLLWVCTEGGGVSMMNLRKKKFGCYQNDYKNLNSISNNEVRALMQDSRGNIWVGTRNGLNCISMEDNTVKRMFNNPASANSLQSNVIISLLQDISGNLWIGSDGSGLARYDIQKGTFSIYTENPQVPTKLSNNAIYSLLEDHTGRIWIGTYGGGISILDQASNLFSRVTIDAASNMQNVVLCLLQDENHDVWAGTIGHGLAKINPATLKVQLYETNPADSQSISNNSIFSIALANDYLWLSTGGSGFDRLDRKSMTFKNFSTQNGLPSNQVRGIMPDEKGNLWISSTKGISRFNMKDETFRNFDVLDGLQANSFQSNSIFKNSKGQLLFGGKKGFNIFFPDSIKDNKTLPNIVLTDFKIFNTSVKAGSNSPLKKQIIAADEVEITYWQNNFMIEFAALCLVAPSKNTYKYIMEGYDEHWIETDYTRRYASYTNLPGGSYTFRVIASNNDGVWNNKGVSIRVIIKPPFWKTWWFMCTLLLVCAYSIYKYIKYREHKSVVQRLQLEQEIEAAVSKVEEQKRAIDKQNEELHKRMEADKESQWINEGLAQFAELTRNNKHDVNELAHVVLSALVIYVDAIQGGIFIATDNTDSNVTLELAASYGYNGQRLHSTTVENGEGLVGNCFKDRKTIHLTNIPDNYLTLETGLGTIRPKTLLLTTLNTDEITTGVIEIAFLHDLKPYQITFIEKLSQNIAFHLHTTNITLKTKKLLEQSQRQKPADTA